MPEIVIIAAVAEENRVIGRDLDLPWRIPEDLRRFKRLTSGHALLMGRRTFESLLHQFGGALKNRRNLVLSRSADYPEHSEVEVFRSVDEALSACAREETVFIGGGAALYKQFIDRADRLELTLVEGSFEGDTYFPPYKQLVGPLYTLAEEEKREGFRFVTYRRTGDLVV